MTRFKQIAAVAAFGAASLCSTAALAVAPFTAAYVFGDSLSDGGNIYLATGGVTGPNPPSNTFIPSAPYAPSNVFSNGPVWFAGFAAGLGLAGSAAPSLLGGGDYAWGGARMATDGAGLPPSVQTQLNGFLTSGPAVSATALYVIAGGGNDVRDVGTAVAGGAPLVGTTTAAATAYATAAAQMVVSLKARGASNIVVWNVPDVGKAPASGAGVGPVAGAASFIAGTFNSFLSTALAGSGVTIFDTYAFIDAVVANPAAYGYANVTQGCGFVGNGCDPATALFWDGIHPTAKTHGIIAGAMLAAVPEPASVWMFMAGLVALGAAWRRRA